MGKSDDDQTPPLKCVCEDCGKKFNKGDEGDNEKFCLRCEYLDREIIEEDFYE